MFRYTYLPLGDERPDHSSRHAGTWVLWIPEDRKSVEPAGIEAWGDPFDVFPEQAMPRLPASGLCTCAPSAWTDLCSPLCHPFHPLNNESFFRCRKNAAFSRTLS